MPGMKAKGAVFRIGSGKEIVLCEGYATGLSIHAASKRMSMNIAVMCCFSASNITEVAKTHGKYVLADNDQSQTGEKVAYATGLPWLMPEQVGMDWNDVHAKYGLMQVCKALMEVRRMRNTAPIFPHGA
jgi:putative DNA primase/helicase